MSARRLDITVTANDQLSAPIGAMTAAASGKFTGFVNDFSRGEKQVGKGLMNMEIGFGKLFKRVASLPALLTGAAAAFGTGKLASGFLRDVDRIDEALERARQLQLKVGTLQTLGFAGRRGNVKEDAIYESLRRGLENIAEAAATGQGSTAEAFKRLGIELVDAQGRVLTMDQALARLISRTKDLSQGERLDVFKSIFGRDGQSIERLTAAGNLGVMRRELEQLNALIRPETAARAKAVSDQVDRLNMAWQGLGNELVTTIGPTAERILDKMAKGTAGLVPLVRDAGTLFDFNMRGNGSANKQAGDLLKGVAEAGINVLWQGAKGAGRLLGEAAIDATAVGIATLSPRVADMLSDAIITASPKTASFLGIEASPAQAVQKAMQERDIARAILGAATRGSNSLQINEPGKAYGPRYDVPGVDEAQRRFAQAQANLGFAQVNYRVNLDARAATATALYTDGLRTMDENILRMRKDLGEAVDAFGVARRQASGFAGVVRGYDAGFGIVRDAARGGGQWQDRLRGYFGLDQQRGPVQVVNPFNVPGADANLPGGLWAGYQQQAAGLGFDLDQRRMRALGMGTEADRAKMVRDFEEQRRAVDELGGVTAEYIGKLEEVQRLELAAFDTRAKADPLLRTLAVSQQEYNDTIEEYRAKLEGGVFNEGLFAANSIDALQRYRDEVKKTVEGLRGLVGENQGAAGKIADDLAAAERTLTQLNTKLFNAQQKPARGLTIGDGLNAGAEDWVKGLGSQADWAANSFKTLAQEGVGGLATAFVDAASRSQDFDDALKGTASSVARSVAMMITQFLILRAVAGIGMALFPGSQTAQAFGAAYGLGKGKASGGWIDGGQAYFRPPNSRDTVLTATEPGEAVLNKYAAAKIGRRGVDALNAGESIGGGGIMLGGVTVHIHGNATATQAREAGKVAAAQILKELETSPVTRARMKGVLT